MKMSAKNKKHEMGEGKKNRMSEYGSATGGIKKKVVKKTAKKTAKKAAKRGLFGGMY